MIQGQTEIQVPLVNVDGLTVGRADMSGRPIVNAVNLQVFKGDVLGIVGESGSGKSTLALAMLGYIKSGLSLHSGRVLVNGYDVLHADAPELAEIRGRFVAYVPQNSGLSLTPTKRIGRLIEEVIAKKTSVPRKKRRDHALELLRSMRLQNAEEIASRYPHELSGGQQQRCAIALAMASEPKLLVLDEPTSALDATTHGELLALLKRLVAERSLSIVCITHDMRVVSRLCSRVAVMYAGEVVEDGPSDSTLRAPRHPYTQGLIRSLPDLSRAGVPMPLPGSPPSSHDVIAGCAFVTRCPVTVPDCAAIPPPIVAFTAGSIRCHNPGTTIPAKIPVAATVSSRDGGGTAPLTVLEVDNVVVRYPKSRGLFPSLIKAGDAPAPAIGGISFSVKASRVMGVIGESGSGKSTLLRAIVGASPVTSGRISLEGNKELSRSYERPLDLRRRIQLVWQNPLAALNPRQTVFDAIAAPLRLYFDSSPAEQRDRAVKLLDLVRLTPQYLDRWPRQLSGGEAQRVAIARACAAEPDIMLCDEITSALDVSVQAAMLSVVESVRSETGCAFLFVSHDLAVIRAIADEVVVLRDGTICESGPTESVLKSPTHPYTTALIEAFGDMPDTIGRDRKFLQSIAS